MTAPDAPTPGPPAPGADRPDAAASGADRGGLASGAAAGLATGVFSIPEGMAYAQLAGVNPLYGLYSGIVATLVASLTTGTVLMISTLTSAIALSTASVLDAAGASDGNAGAVFTITLLTGGIMLVLGLLRLGLVVNFVSQGVMTGFVAAASLLIVVGEMGDFSGYDPQGANKLAQIVDWFANIGHWEPTTTTVAVVTVLLVLAGKRIPAIEKLAPVLVLAVMTVAVALLGLPSVATVADIAEIPRGLPTPTLPDFSLIPDLALGSVSVAIVALVQGSGISTAYPNPDGSRASVDRDFIGQGLGNVAAAFFQSMPTGGSLSRTGISVGGGAANRWGGVFAAVWLALLVLLFGSLAEAVPLAVIAGLLFVIGVELIVGRLATARLTEHASFGSLVAMTVTFATALFIPLQWTIFIGAGLSLVLYIAASYRAGRAFRLVRRDDGYWRETDLPEALPSGQVVAIGFRGTWFYAEVPRLRDRMPDPADATGSVVILRMRHVPDMHGTGLSLLDDYVDRLAAGGNVLLLEGVGPRLHETLARTGLEGKIGGDHIFEVTDGITESLDCAWDHAHELLAADSSW